MHYNDLNTITADEYGRIKNHSLDLKNKSFAVVSSSSSLIGKNLGSYIDSFDYVVKFNGSVLVQAESEYCKDFGSKDDIHFFTNPYIKIMNPKLELYPYVKLFLYKFFNAQYERFPYEIIRQSFRQVEKFLHGTSSFSGLAVINFITRFNPKKIELFGMNMYVNQPKNYIGEWDHYYPGYIPEEMKQLTDDLHMNKPLPHSRYWSAQILLKLIQKKHIICNEELIKNINFILKNFDTFR